MSRVTNLHFTFSKSALTDLNISGWKFAALAKQTNTFELTAINKLDLSLWDNKGAEGQLTSPDTFLSMSNLQILMLNPDFRFFNNDSFTFTPPTNETYTGKWQAVGSGTVDDPKGAELTVAELRALYMSEKLGPLETYVWQKVAKPLGNLKVSKTVTGTAGELDKEFSFTITLDDKTVSGKYGDMTFAEGKAEFVLKNGESKTASGLPADIGYTVTESNNEGYTVTKTGDTGKIVKDETAEAVYTNQKDAPPSPSPLPTPTASPSPSPSPTPSPSPSPNAPSNQAPKTGDTSIMILWVIILAVAVIGVVLVILLIAKKDKTDE
ncbi:MAG: hypothetical protein GX684_04260 [Ruminococcaceae bacterium]|nr:hypothetical protein [Oscillospiraceae bacterium]